MSHKKSIDKIKRKKNNESGELKKKTEEIKHFTLKSGPGFSKILTNSMPAQT